MNDTKQHRFIHGIQAAFAAVAEGTATPEQHEIHSSFLAALPHVLDDPDAVRAVAQHAGSFASVYEAPWEELNALGQWIRHEAAEADRAVPALASMYDVYEALVAATNHSGVGLRLSPGSNVIGLDGECRRWLLPMVPSATVAEAYNADSLSDAKRALRQRGAVTYRWSIERSALVPSPDTLAERMPLPVDGRYLLVYQGSVAILAKAKFRDAVTRLIQQVGLADLLIWDTAPVDGATLWSVRGNLGHVQGRDLQEWPEDIGPFAAELAQSF